MKKGKPFYWEISWLERVIDCSKIWLNLEDPKKKKTNKFLTFSAEMLLL